MCQAPRCVQSGNQPTYHASKQTKTKQRHSLLFVSGTTCSNLASAPSNGAVLKSDGDYHDSVASFSCNTGYKLSGTASVTCSAPSSDQAWPSASPTCTRTLVVLVLWLAGEWHRLILLRIFLKRMTVAYQRSPSLALAIS